MIQRQFGENVEMLPPRKFRFADRGQQARIEIQFQRNIPDSGWILALESNNKVHVETSGSHTGFLYVWESVTLSPFFQLPQYIYVGGYDQDNTTTSPHLIHTIKQSV